MQCSNCGRENPPDSLFCNACGTAAQPSPQYQQAMNSQQQSPLTSVKVWWNNQTQNTQLIILLGISVLILIIIISATINNSPNRQASAPATNSNTRSQSAATNTAPAIPASVHLANAKKALADGYVPSGKNKAWGRVKDARESLQLINYTDKEYAEAQKLLREVERREAEIEEWSKTAARKLVAEQMERNYLEKNMDVTVTVSGPNNTTIKLKYVLISRPLVYQLTNDSEFMGNLRSAGFKKVIFTDGYFNTWTQDLQ